MAHYLAGGLTVNGDLVNFRRYEHGNACNKVRAAEDTRTGWWKRVDSSILSEKFENDVVYVWFDDPVHDRNSEEYHNAMRGY